MYPTQRIPLLPLIALSVFVLAELTEAQQRRRPGGPGGGGRFAEQERIALQEGFTGLTTDGSVVPDLFSIKSTGVSTKPVRVAADAFLAALSPEERAKTLYNVDDDEWRKWANQHSYPRQGVSFEDMTEEQRALAFALLEASLSARGLQTTQDIMKLNETLAELKNDWEGYGEWKYHLTIMGEPSDTKPWGWQFDGHHAVINYFILGDQVVMSPVFLGSEPVVAESGKYEGTIIMQEEQDDGLAFMRSLTPEQQAKATISGEKGPTNNLAEAFKDNLITDYIGIKGADLDQEAKSRLLDLIAVFINHQSEGHAQVRLAEVKEHLDDTWFAWIGKTDPDAVFYYRIQSPVIYIEFDHQRPIGLERTGVPTRNHIHAVIRTPNGNDYGKDLLRQHYENHHQDK
ncbi:MAG: DUF3500 domain-containing protein [Verrucomicrobiota bacterium]